jgi:PAS domain S-box-containing protein
VFEEAPFGIAAVDMAGNFVRVNRAFCLLHGRERSEAEMMSIADFTVSGDESQYEATLGLARDGEVSLYRNEHRIVRPDGSERWALITATTIHDTSGEAVYALIQYHDTTPLHEIKEIVRQTTETLDLTFESAPIAIYSVDLEGRGSCSAMRPRRCSARRSRWSPTRGASEPMPGSSVWPPARPSPR